MLSTAERTVKRECEMQCGRGGQQYAVCPGRAGVLDAGWLALPVSQLTSFLVSHVHHEQIHELIYRARAQNVAQEMEIN